MNYNIPRPRFGIEVDRLTVGLETACLGCRRRFKLAAAVWLMRIGHEIIGYFCPNCLKPAAQERLIAAGKGVADGDD